MKQPTVSEQERLELEQLTAWIRSNGCSGLEWSGELYGRWKDAVRFTPGTYRQMLDRIRWFCCASESSTSSVELANSTRDLLSRCIDWCECEARNRANIGIREPASLAGPLVLRVNPATRQLHCTLDGWFVGWYEDEAIVRAQDDEVLQQILVELKALGRRTYSLDFSGGGDEGAVDHPAYDLLDGGWQAHYLAMEQGHEPERNLAFVESIPGWCTENLSNLFPGWYIDEGSFGTIRFNVAEGICKFGFKGAGQHETAQAELELKF